MITSLKENMTTKSISGESGLRYVPPAHRQIKITKNQPKCVESRETDKSTKNSQQNQPKCVASREIKTFRKLSRLYVAVSILSLLCLFL